MSETINKEQIRNAFAARFSQFPVTVQESPDDVLVLCVRVFAVPPEMVKEVKTFIRQLEQEILQGSDHVLLPMVKNLQVTQVHYPEYLPNPVATMIAQLFSQQLTTEDYQSVCAAEQSPWKTFATEPSLKLPSVRFAPDILRGYYVKHHQPDLLFTAANEELALAA